MLLSGFETQDLLSFEQNVVLIWQELKSVLKPQPLLLHGCEVTKLAARKIRGTNLQTTRPASCLDLAGQVEVHLHFSLPNAVAKRLC